MNEELKKEILDLIQQNPLNYGQCCQSKSRQELKNKILQATSNLNEKYTFKTRIFWILNDIFNFPKCYICGKSVTKEVTTLKFGYNKNKIWEKDDIKHLTCDNKECIKTKQKEQFKQTCLEKYGVNNVWKLKEVKEKIAQTCLKKYGAIRGGNTITGRNKAKTTWLTKYGVTNPLKNKEIQKKLKNTCLQKYGETSFTKTKKYHDIIVKQNLKKFIDKILIYNDPEITFLNIINEKNSFSSIHDFWNTKLHMHCKKCGNDFLGYPNFNNFYKFQTYSSCQNCHPSFSASIYEKQITNFLKNISNNLNLELNSRNIIKPYELDIYVPNLKLAFEFDGVYWHSSAINDIQYNYHLMKTELCEKQGIQLIHIFENEWLYKQDIVKSRIKNLLGIYDKTIFARKCIIKQISTIESKQFQDKNHIQGSINAKVNLGLYYKDELVSLMTFGKCRFSKKYEWELLRFCNKLGYHIPGAASKLLNYFEKVYKPKSLVSYADRRWSQGKLYNVLGFILDHISSPNYWYIVNGNLESRVKYQKHKLSKILKTFDENKSEVENMKDNGYYRIFDCGNYVFAKMY